MLTAPTYGVHISLTSPEYGVHISLTAPAYGVHISQLLRYPRASIMYSDFLQCHRILTTY
jgi:hypothetical protein